MKFRKKPVLIEARQLPIYPTASAYDIEKYPVSRYLDECIAIAKWCGGVSHMMNEANEHGGPHVAIPTLEGTMMARPGDWIIRGVKGEFYPCKPDIFEAIYEAFDPNVIHRMAQASWTPSSRAEIAAWKESLVKVPETCGTVYADIVNSQGEIVRAYGITSENLAALENIMRALFCEIRDKAAIPLRRAWCEDIAAFRFPHLLEHDTEDGWRKEPPGESGLWWWWGRDEDSAPIPVFIAYSGTDGTYFAEVGQFGWTEHQPVKEMGGLWMRLHEPKIPALK